MKQIKLLSMHIQDFKGCKDRVIEFGQTTRITGDNGVYVVELTATDEAGNIAYTAKYILTIDITALRVKLQRYPYSAKVRVGRYFARLK